MILGRPIPQAAGSLIFCTVFAWYSTGISKWPKFIFKKQKKYLASFLFASRVVALVCPIWWRIKSVFTEFLKCRYRRNSLAGTLHEPPFREEVLWAQDFNNSLCTSFKPCPRLLIGQECWAFEDAGLWLRRLVISSMWVFDLLGRRASNTSPPGLG